MTFDLSMLIGAAAAFASIASFTPQAWKIVKTRDTSSLSTGMYALTVAGFSLWLTYGVVTQQWPIILTNAICLLLSSFILMMKLLPSNKKDAVADVIDP